MKNFIPHVFRVAIHELYHTLGIQHTHQRHDRDNYVTINEENVQDYYKYALAPEDDIALGTFDFPYDYLSIMHYDKVAFSNGNGETIIPKEEFEM